jgi:thiosulfate/3-mercaptopyruvate sulfurtransferase
MRRSIALAAALLIAVGVPTRAVALRATTVDTTLAARASVDMFVVSTEWLAAHLHDPKLVLVEVVSEEGKRTARIPGSRELFYRRMAVRRDSLSTELPSPDSLKTLFEGLGISDDSRVIVYAAEAPMATRMLMTLAYIGHTNASYLDGGMPKWLEEQRATAAADTPVARGTITLRVNPALVVDADWISARIGTPAIALIDTRTPGEYLGTGNRSGMPSAGHLTGARNLEWEFLFREDKPLLLKDRDVLRTIYEARVPKGSTVVTYCWVGYRASATYFVARVLGYDTKFYDGSYQDWQRRGLPVRGGEAP